MSSRAIQAPCRPVLGLPHRVLVLALGLVAPLAAAAGEPGETDPMTAARAAQIAENASAAAQSGDL